MQRIYSNTRGERSKKNSLLAREYESQREMTSSEDIVSVLSYPGYPPSVQAYLRLWSLLLGNFSMVSHLT